MFCPRTNLLSPAARTCTRVHSNSNSNSKHSPHLSTTLLPSRSLHSASVLHSIKCPPTVRQPTKTHFPYRSSFPPRTFTPHQLYPVLTTIRTVPESIEAPDYARPGYNGGFFSQGQEKQIEIKDPKTIEAMRKACRYASMIREYAGSCIIAGRTTEEVDRMVHEYVLALNIYPSPLGYYSFPKSLCTSINEVICHGIPDTRPLQDGDIVNCDVSCYVDGVHGDCSGMFTVGNVDANAKKLMYVTRTSLDKAISICAPGVPFSMIGDVISEYVVSEGFSVVREFTGHGIGSRFHQLPHVYHVPNNVHEQMQVGMTFTIEPMVNEGRPEVQRLKDEWTIMTVDGGRSAQYEETILITPTGAEILTKHQIELPQ